MRSSHVSWRISLGVVALCTYLPYSWVLWIDYPWSDYRIMWIKMWPILPGLVPTAWINAIAQRYLHVDGVWLDGALTVVVSGMFTLALIAGLTWLGMRGRLHLAFAVVITIPLHILCALGTYAAMRH